MVAGGAHREEGDRMTTPTNARYRAALNPSSMDDTEVTEALASIQKVAQQGPLFQLAAIAASYAALATKGTNLSTAIAQEAADAAAHRKSVTARDTARLTFDRELDTYKTLVQNNATSADDVTGMGLSLQTVMTASRTPPDPPAALLVHTGKQHGKARVVVAGKGYQGLFAAQVSTDPIGPTTWSPLPGVGKQRKLSGYPTGTKLWVQFATIRFGMQSAWCTPVLVTIP
jgi:hypothetical protein